MTNTSDYSVSLLGNVQPFKAIVKLALTAVGVTVPLLLIMVSIENIFVAGAVVLAGRQLDAKDMEGASSTVTTIIGISIGIGIFLCALF